MRTLKSILLAGAMLLAIPAFFSSCQEDAPQIDYTMSVTVTNDFSKVVDASTMVRSRTSRPLPSLRLPSTR